MVLMPFLTSLNLESNFFLLTLILGLLALVFFILYLWQVYENWRINKDQKQILEDNQLKGYDVLHSAIKKSEDVLGDAELEAVKIAADSRYRSDQLEKKYEHSLSDLTSSEKASIEKVAKDLQDYLNSLSNKLGDSVTNSEQLIQEKVNQLFEKFEQNLSTYLTQTQQQSSKAIDLEMQSARQ